LTVFVIAHSDSQKLLAMIDRFTTHLRLSIVVFDGGSTDDTLLRRGFNEGDNLEPTVSFRPAKSLLGLARTGTGDWLDDFQQ
jgi:hypothetical protein